MEMHVPNKCAVAADTNVFHSSRTNANNNEHVLKEDNNNEDGLVQLISNLDHEIPPIKFRALKSLQTKLEHGLLDPKVLCKRVDLMHRLACWLRSPKLTQEEIHLIVKFLSAMCENEEFTKNFLSTQLDSLVAIAKIVVRPDTRILINQLLDSVQCISMHYEGSPAWNDNTNVCTPLESSRSGISGSGPGKSNLSARSRSQIKEIEIDNVQRLEKGQGELDSIAPREYYFSKSALSTYSKGNASKTIEFDIPNIQLQVTDRRVLSSTTESILSKDERLVFMTTCFIRDVLLNDFPAEIFIQEIGLPLSLVQVAEESWENERVNYSAFQGLLKLSNLLRKRLIALDYSDYYNPCASQQKRPMSYHSGRQSSQYLARETSKDYFINNLSQLLKGIIRGLNFKSSFKYMWILLNSFSLVFEKCFELFGRELVAFPIHSQEVLLELAQYFLKYTKFVNPPVLATAMTSLLSCFENAEIVLSKDIRHAIWNLASKTNLQESSPSVFKWFVEKANNFQPGLGNNNVPKSNNLDSDFELDIYNEWWKYDRTESHLKENMEPGTSPNPKTILSTLYSIQNATQHSQVQKGIEYLWEAASPLLLNRKRRGNPEIASADSEVISESNILEWREALDKFITIEPTCAADEELLACVLDLMSFLITWLDNSNTIRSWIQPLVTEKGSALLRVLIQNCLHKDSPSVPSEGTTLSVILRSTFDFYNVIFFGHGKELVGPDVSWDFLQLLAQILDRISIEDFSQTAQLHCVLQGLANLTCSKTIIEKLDNNEQFAKAVLSRLVEAVYFAQEKAGTDSFRNRTSIRLGAESMLHLAIILGKTETRSNDWCADVVKILPHLWSGEEFFVRVVGFQISDILIQSARGTAYVLSKLESPLMLWRSAYSHLMSAEELPVVRHAAGRVFLNIINSWSEIKNVIDPHLEIPKWKLLEDLTSLLTNVYWHERVSSESHNSQNKQDVSEPFSEERMDEDLRPVITPKVLKILAKLITRLINVSEENATAGSVPSQAILRELCCSLFRLVGEHQVTDSMKGSSWADSCSALANVIQSLTVILRLNPRLSLIPLADKFSLSALIKLFSLKSPDGLDTRIGETSLSILWFHVIALLTTVSSVSGQHFEDLERIILSHRNIIFPTLVKWADTGVDTRYRVIAIEFLTKFLTICCTKEEREKGRSHLSALWLEADNDHGSAICGKLILLLNSLTRVQERVSVLVCLDIVLRFLKSSITFAVNHNIIGSLMKTIKAFGVKSIEINSQYEKKDVKGQEEIKWVLLLFASIFHGSKESRELALSKGFPDALHITKLTSHAYINNSDRVLLHTLLESLVNYTTEFPEGAHSLTLTTGLVGVASRKTATPNSLLIEILNILQNELDNIEGSPNIKTVEQIMPLLNNVIFSQECRNIVVKTNILNFIRRLLVVNVKKWNSNQQYVKHAFLQFIVHLTVHPDLQLYVAKIDGAVDLLTQMAEFDSHPGSLMCLEILRNLSFHSGNRARLLTDSNYLAYLSKCLNSSDSVAELKCATVAVWALISNCERGKVAVKNFNCGYSMDNAMMKLRKKQPTSREGKEVVQSLINLLEKTTKVLNGSTEPELSEFEL